MDTTATPTPSRPTPEAPDRVSISPLLERIAEELETVLRNMPDGNLDARNLITRELNLEPLSDELQTIVRIARDLESRGARREYPRRLLVIRLLADREIEHLRERSPLSSEWLDRCAEVLPQVAAEARRTEEELSNAIGTDATLPPADREFLLQVGRTFSYSRARLVAAFVLAERLAQVTRVVERGELTDVFPSSFERERRLLESAVGPADTVDDTAGPSRIWVDAVALRLSLGRDLGLFGEMPSWESADQQQRLEREELIERLRRGRIGCEATAERLQQQQDQAMVAGLHGSAEEIRELGRGLFSMKLKLAAVLRDPYADPPPMTDATDEATVMREGLRAAAAVETAIELSRRVTKEELFLGALKDVKRTDEAAPVVLPPGVDAAKRRRRRMAVMVGVAVVLAAISLTVNFVLLPPRADLPEQPTARELKSAASVTRVDSAGGMLFTHVDDWAELDKPTRRERVKKLAEEAESRGFVSLWVLDEFNLPAAQWSKSGGTQLIDPPTAD